MIKTFARYGVLLPREVVCGPECLTWQPSLKHPDPKEGFARISHFVCFDTLSLSGLESVVSIFDCI
jgi:hypothetical protein